jgi:hypothetical protein
MREFFRGSRRKTGAVALVLAVLALGFWQRSRVLEDVLVWQRKDVAHVFKSLDSGLSWSTYAESRRVGEGYWCGSIPIRPQPYHGWWQLKEECESKWEYGALGFRTGTATKTWESSSSHARYWMIPYWGLTMALALAAAYMILTPPPKQPTTAKGSDAGAPMVREWIGESRE